jgi:putative MATE family efflux protein
MTMQSHTTRIPLCPELLTRTVIRLAVPAIGESLLTTFVLMANTILVGWLHDDVALAAVGLSSSLLWIANGLFRSAGTAATALVARFLGQGDVEMAKRSAAQTMTLGLVAATLVTILVMPLSDDLLRLVGGEPEVVRQGRLYMNIVLATSVLSFPMLVAGGVMRGAGDTRTPMIIALVTNVCNIVAGCLLIFGPGPLPALGLVGAAMSTSLARSVGGCLAFGLLLLGGGTRFQVEPRRLLTWSGSLARRILRLATPDLGREAVQRVGGILFIRIVATLGTASVGAHQIAVRVESMSFMQGVGFSMAAAALVGQSLGAERTDFAERSVRRVLSLACGAMGLMGIVFIVAGRELVTVFGATPEVLRLAGTAVQIAGLEQITIATHMVLGGALRGAGDTRTPLYVTAFGVLFFRVAVVYLFAITFGWGLDGVWLGTVVDWAGRAGLMVLLFRRGRWKSIRV